MSRAADEARTRLWFWLGEADDSDAEQAAWKRRRLEGMLLACERARILPPDELPTWREMVARGAVRAARGGDTQATERHLELLVAELRPLSRHAQPSGRKGHHFRDALAALHAAGVLDDSARAEWQARELAATAPWLAADAIAQITASPEALWAIGVPAETPEQEAADAADAAEREASTRRGELRRVVVAREPLRRDGVAVIAVVARSEATDVVFHYVGPPHGDTSGGWADLEAFGQIVDSLTPPALTDDAGTTYQPVSPRPVSSYGTGGIPDPERPRVVTGVWRYRPGAPAAAQRFVVTLGGARWELDQRDAAAAWSSLADEPGRIGAAARPTQNCR